MWTREETTYLIQTILDYKVKQAAAGCVWTDLSSKYDDILRMYNVNYPKDEPKFPREGEPMTMKLLISKIKRIKKMYRKALRLRSRDEAGKTVSQNYELLEQIWGADYVEDETEEDTEYLDARSLHTKQTRMSLDLIA